MNALALKSSHVPYRESKLTHLLKESLGGDSKSLLIIQVSPDPRELSETMSTLQFGTRVMKVEKGRPKSCILQEVDTNNPKSLVLSSSPDREANLKASASVKVLTKAESPASKLDVSLSVANKGSESSRKDKENGLKPAGHAHTKSLKVTPFMKNPTQVGNSVSNAPLTKKGRSNTLSDNSVIHVLDLAKMKRESMGKVEPVNSKSKVNTSMNK